MNIKLQVMCWIRGKESAHEVVEINEEQLLEILRGAAKPVFKTPIEKQFHWELRQVSFK